MVPAVRSAGGRQVLAFTFQPPTSSPVRESLAPILLSACLGALVGLIRQWSDQVSHEGHIDLGGMRTYSMWAMLGCVAALLSESAAPGLLVAVGVLVGAHQIVAMAKTPTRSRPGGTTFASALLTILVGALVYWDDRQAAVVVAATVMVLLGLKQPLHAWTRRFTEGDIRATLQFVAITGVILPLVPDENYGPYDAFNPYKIWLLVVLISGIGFLGYLAMRGLGAKAGILVTGLFGGLASSTATTLAFSRRSREDPGDSEHYAMGIVIACCAMLARVAVAVSVLNLKLGLALVPPFALMAFPGVGYGTWLWFRRRPGLAPVHPPHLENPLSLRTAVKFAVLYAVIGFLVKAIMSRERLQGGLIPLSFLSGLTDVDAISLSIAGSGTGAAVPLHLALQAVLVAAAANSLTKAGFAVSLGSPVLRKEVSLVLGLTALAGVAGCWIF
ncbi:MAG: hypothetical protein JWM88_2640 [Verrucomicrobia bacterium]|nr:hypothetical protein [Verrucomicrobiota bacterium]